MKNNVPGNSFSIGWTNTSNHPYSFVHMIREYGENWFLQSINALELALLEMDSELYYLDDENEEGDSIESESLEIYYKLQSILFFKKMIVLDYMENGNSR